jgi:hypothetical protein
LGEIEPCLSPDFSVIGSAIHEVADKRSEAIRLYEEDLNQITQPVEVANEKISLIRISDNIAQIMATMSLRGEFNRQKFELPNFRLSALYKYEAGHFYLCHWHSSLPQEDAGVPESFPIRRTKKSA